MNTGDLTPYCDEHELPCPVNPRKMQLDEPAPCWFCNSLTTMAVVDPSNPGTVLISIQPQPGTLEYEEKRRGLR